MTTNLPPTEKLYGYQKFARQIEIRPECAIFRCFGALNAESLLYRQAELSDLEESLRKQQKEDHDSGKTSYSRSWFELNNSEYDGDTTQLNMILEIREKLRQYNEALIQQASILDYSTPVRSELEYVQNFLHAEIGQPLCGSDSETWGTFQGSKEGRKDQKPDLIALRPRIKEDPFSNFAVEKTIGCIFQCGCDRFMKRSRIHGVVGYEDTTVFKITYWITSIVASLVPILSIVILSTVRSAKARLGVIAVFNMLISICLSGLTNAKRSEVFAVTAAFAAVQVVFVSAEKI